jgi:hypothetical protein
VVRDRVGCHHGCVSAVAQGVPFRWDLVTPERLGSLLSGTPAPDLWFLDDLVACAAKVLARSGNGDLVFVGRSLDSMFDLLSGALAAHAAERRLRRLPLSFQRSGQESRRRWRPRSLSAGERAQARRFLTTVDADPYTLARRRRPVTFVDVVSAGRTFTELFNLLDDWIVEQRQPWQVIRRKLRFVGVTWRGETSPNTYRWQQHAVWTRRLPASAVVNVSLHPAVCSYFGNHQTKLTRTLRPEQWLAEPDGPGRDESTRVALAEAVALVSYGRSRSGRRAVTRAIRGQPALAQPWLRTLIADLNAR